MFVHKYNYITSCGTVRLLFHSLSYSFGGSFNLQSCLLQFWENFLDYFLEILFLAILIFSLACLYQITLQENFFIRIFHLLYLIHLFQIFPQLCLLAFFNYYYFCRFWEGGIKFTYLFLETVQGTEPRTLCILSTCSTT